MKGLLTIVFLLAVGGGVFWLGQLRRDSDDKPLLHIADEVALTVNVAKPTQERIIRIVQAPGDVEPVLEVEISSEIVAKIDEMPVEEGDIVKKGQLLCRLDDDNLRADLESSDARIAQLHASIRQTDADLEKAERDMNRQKRLAETNATSALEMQDYMTTFKKAKASREMRQHELAQAEAMQKRLNEDISRTVITSPIDGVISRLVAKQGEVVVTGTMNNPGTVIMTISDMSRMQVRARVDEVDVPRVSADQKARIYLQADADVPVPAHMAHVSSKGSKLTGRDVVTFETLLEVQSTDPRIKPGMTANVEIEVDHREEAITVPVEAVVHRMRKDLPDEIVEAFDKMQGELDVSERVRQAQYIKVVYVMEEEAAMVRLVDPGIADTRKVELRSGVKMDDTIITGPYRSLDQLKDGKKVALSEEDKKSAEDETKEGEEEEQLAEDEEEAKEDDTKLAGTNP